ncbi:MAG: DUF1653 domain-containing protein [Ruminococcaceae bacterium]|nr:DUF1653 domain-containing protein [Oscillospiraceae bacterium]
MEYKKGKYKHFKGREYELIDVVTHSETMEKMILYKPLYNDSGMWVRPASMWDEEVVYNGCKVKRFTYIEG